MKSARSAAVLLAALLALVLAVAACSPPAENSGSGGGVRHGATSDCTGSVQINTAQGDTVLVDCPKRIVTLGAQWIDTALAFGVTPIGYLDTAQIASHAESPWAAGRLADSTQLNPNDIVTEIAKLEPDLVLAEAFMPQQMPEAYEKIKALGPTIAGISGKQVDSWQDLTKVMGLVLGEADTAEQITADVNGKIDALATELPGLRGKTYTLAWAYAADNVVVMADPTDGAGATFSALGMTIAPKILEKHQSTGQQRFDVSLENVPMLESSLLLIAASTPDLMTSLTEAPGYDALTSVEKGAVQELTIAEIVGLNQPTPLSIPYMLDKIRPALEKAAR